MTTRPRAADDFAAIRARIQELRRERAQVVDDEMDQTPSGPRLNYPRSCFTCAERPQKITTDERLKSTRPAKGNAEA